MKIHRFPFVLLTVTSLIIVAVTFPGNALPDLGREWIGFDKLVHMLMFLVWAVAFHADFGIETGKNILQAFVVCILFSLFTEFLQLFAEGRSFDLYDGLFDLIGFSVGIIGRKIFVLPLSVFSKEN